MTDALAAETPLRRVAQPREVAYGVLYLASDEASYVCHPARFMALYLARSVAPCRDHFTGRNSPSLECFLHYHGYRTDGKGREERVSPDWGSVRVQEGKARVEGGETTRLPGLAQASEAEAGAAARAVGGTNSGGHERD